MNDDWTAMVGREVPGRHGTWTDAGDPDRQTGTMTARVAAGEGV